MAKTKSIGLSKRLSKVKGLAAIAEKEVDHGNSGDLPVIDAGIARLVDCYFALFKNGNNKGKPYFLAAAEVLEPEFVDVNGVPVRVKGMRTQIMIGIHDSPNSTKYPTTQDAVGRVFNHMKLLGADVKGRITGDEDADEIEVMAAELVEEAPVFGFRTWKGKPSEKYPNPKVNHDWKAAIADYEVEEDDDVDDSEPEEETTSEDDQYEDVNDDDSSSDDTSSTAEDIMEVAKQADEDYSARDEEDPPTEACARMEELCQQHGVEGWEDMDTYVEMAEAIQAKVGGSNDNPSVGDMIKYKQGRMKSAADAEVLEDLGDGKFKVRKLSDDKEVDVPVSKMQF